jgi:hypothetical protein
VAFFAICSNSACSHYIALEAEKVANPHLSSEACPACGSALIFFCPVCYWSLLEKPALADPRCSRCGAKLRHDAKGHSG